jgi:broad specificity phosphatase PhoE
MRSEHVGASVAVVSHGFTLRILSAHLFAVPPGMFASMAPMANTALTLVRFNGAGPEIVIANDDSHVVDQPLEG